jgi:hypothetical protein
MAAKYMPSVETIERSILSIRDHRVMLDADLADLYRVPTKVLNQAVKRNKDRFPPDFMFQLTTEEKDEVVTSCDHLRRLKISPTLPFTFTEHRAIMLANVLRSRAAVHVSIQIVRAFIKLREAVALHKDLARRLKELESKYDAQFKAVFDALRRLMTPPEPKERKIGFIIKERGHKIRRVRNPREALTNSVTGSPDRIV